MASKKNVLLLNLSEWNKSAKNPREYYNIEKKEGEEEQRFDGFTGWMTNEAPAKVLIHQLKRKNRRLDRIVVIESDRVRNMKIEPTDEAREKISMPLTEMTMAEYYRKVITAYALEIDRETYEKEPIEFCSVPIADEPEENEVTEVVLQAADYAADCHLHIDFNGGPRYVAFMQLAIANILHQRGVKVENVWTMTFNENKGPIQVVNQSYLFDSFDLLSGLHECIRLGRIKSLKDHFRQHLSQEAETLLGDLSEFINNLQLCRTSLIMEKRADLKQRLEQYNQTNAQTERQKDYYEQLFCFVIQDILREYDGLLTADLPGMIKWCLKKEFTMQALTFCSEQLPGYFWETCLLAPTEAEKKEFDMFLELVLENQENKKSKAFRELSMFYREASNERIVSPSSFKNRAYCWMNKYLCYSPTYESKYKPGFHYPETMSLCKMNVALKTQSGEGFKLRVQHGNRGKLFSSLIQLYYEMKDQRNFSNHADDTPQVERNREPLSYEDLRDRIYRLLNVINQLTLPAKTES